MRAVPCADGISGWSGSSSACFTSPQTWKASDYFHVLSPVRVLQFGHGVDAVDDAVDQLDPPKPYALQFGHGVDAVDDKSAQRGKSFRGSASIRPRRRRRG